MKRILALDLGEKRVGVALSDTLQMFAHPYKTIRWRGINSFLNELEQIIQSDDIETVVVGMPYTLKGGYSKKTNEVAEIIETLKERLSIPVIGMDERFTTKMAQQALKTVGKKSSKQRQRIDQIAAVFILESYLARIKNQSHKEM